MAVWLNLESGSRFTEKELTPSHSRMWTWPLLEKHISNMDTLTALKYLENHPNLQGHQLTIDNFSLVIDKGPLCQLRNNAGHEFTLGEMTKAIEKLKSLDDTEKILEEVAGNNVKRGVFKVNTAWSMYVLVQWMYVLRSWYITGV